MKNFTLIPLFYFLIGLLGAQPSRLIFYSEKGETFQIEMDGKLRNEIPSYYLKLDPVFSGKHFFTLRFAEKGMAPIAKTFSVKPGWEYTFLIRKTNADGALASVQFRGQQLLLNGLIVWAGNAGYEVRQISGINLNSAGADAFTRASSGNNTVVAPQDGATSNPNSFSGGSGATFDYGAAQGYTSPSGYAGPTGTVVDCNMATETSVFEMALSKVRNNGGGPEQKAGAKEFLNNNCINAAQARNLVSEFASENDRLEMAKYAWHRTVDKANFFVLNDSFSSQASIDALSVYMKGNP